MTSKLKATLPIAALCTAMLGLSACVEVQQAVDSSARATARNVVPEALAVYFPQVPKELFTPFTNCVIDNATADEIKALAQDSLIGVSLNTKLTIRTILSRPETAQCLTSAVPGQSVTL